MLKEASVAAMNKLKIPKNARVLVNRGRGNDDLAPADALYQEMMRRRTSLEKELGKGNTDAHNRAFLECDFAQRFRAQITSSPEALVKLEGIANRAKAADLYLVCYEGPSKACHRRVLMRIAEEMFGAEAEIVGVEPHP